MKLHFWQFSPNSKINFWPFLKLQKMEFGQKKFPEIDLFDFTSFLAWTFLKFLAYCETFMISHCSRQYYKCAKSCWYYFLFIYFLFETLFYIWCRKSWAKSLVFDYTCIEYYVVSWNFDFKTLWKKTANQLFSSKVQCWEGKFSLF